MRVKRRKHERGGRETRVVYQEGSRRYRIQVLMDRIRKDHGIKGK